MGTWFRLPTCWEGNGRYLQQCCCQQKQMQAQQLLLAVGLISSCTLYLQLRAAVSARAGLDPALALALPASRVCSACPLAWSVTCECDLCLLGSECHCVSWGTF